MYHRKYIPFKMDFHSVLTNIPLDEFPSGPFASDDLFDDCMEHSMDSSNSKICFPDIKSFPTHSDYAENGICDDSYVPNIEDTISLKDLYFDQIPLTNTSEDSEMTASSCESTMNCILNEQDADHMKSLSNHEEGYIFNISEEALMFQRIENKFVSIKSNCISQSDLKDTEYEVVNNKEKTSNRKASSLENSNANDCTGNQVIDNAEQKPKNRTSISKEVKGGGIVQWVYNDLCRGSKFFEWENRTLLIFKIREETKDELASAWFKTRKMRKKERDITNDYDYFQ